MARPVKSLRARVRDGSFLARKHHPLLAGTLLEWPNFAALQHQYVHATSEPQARAIALEFQQLVTDAHRETQKRGGSQGDPSVALRAELLTLGKHGSAAQLLKFFPCYLAHTTGPMVGRPFQLERWQQQFLREFYHRDKHGHRIYRTGVLGVPRGNGKTPLAAGLGLYELISRVDRPEVYFAAGSKEQAGIGQAFARSFVENGGLTDWVSVKNALRCPASRGIMQVVSSEGNLQHGRMPAAVYIDELWAFDTARQEQTYNAFATALHKRDDAYILSITTAGYDSQSLLGRIYDQAHNWPDVTISTNGCLTIAKDEENGQLLYWYSAPQTADLEDQTIWRAANPASWLNMRDLKRQLHDPGISEHEFRRLHLNQWTATRDAWLPDGCWKALRSDQTILAGSRVFVGVDIGIKHDSTAVCLAHKLEDGRILLQADVWSANPKALAHHHCPDGRVELEAIERFIADLARRYKVVEVAYDPRYFQRSAEHLEKAGLTMVEFLQASAPMADAYQAFYQLATEGTLAHNGDPIFTSHIEATAAELTERGWKVRKLKNNKHIDATVAAVMATGRANTHKPNSPQVFWLET